MQMQVIVIPPDEPWTRGNRWIFNAVQRSTYFPEANLLVPLILLPYLKNKYLCFASATEL